MRHSRALATGAVLLTLAACTGETPEPPSTPTPTASETSSASPPLGQDELTRALLERAHLGKAFTQTLVPDAEFHTVFDDPDGRFGCLRAVDQVDFGVPDERTAAVTLDAKNNARTPHVVHVVGSADSEDDAAAGFQEAAVLLQACDRVRTRREGLRVDAAVRTNQHRANAAVDQQLNIRAVGTLRILRSRFPIGVWVSVVRFGDLVTIISVLDLDKDDAAAQRELTEAAVRRLTAVDRGGPLPKVKRVELEFRLPR